MNAGAAVAVAAAAAVSAATAVSVLYTHRSVLLASLLAYCSLLCASFLII